MGTNFTDIQYKMLYDGDKPDDAEINDDYDQPIRQRGQDLLVIDDFVKDVKDTIKQRPSIQREFVVPKPKSAINLNDKTNEKDADYEMLELKVSALKKEVQDLSKEILQTKKESDEANERALKLEHLNRQLEERLVGKNSKTPQDTKSESDAKI